LEEINQYLRSLLSRATELKTSLSRIDVRHPELNESFANRLAVVSQQCSAIYADLYTNPQYDGVRAAATSALIQPLQGGYDPSVTLRTKPIVELDDYEKTLITNFNQTNNGLTQSQMETYLLSYHEGFSQLHQFIVNSINEATVDTTMTTTAQVSSAMAARAGQHGLTQDELALQTQLRAIQTAQIFKPD